MAEENPLQSGKLGLCGWLNNARNVAWTSNGETSRC